MSDHLPECNYEPEHWDVEQSILWGGKPCICPALRACEQRVLLSKPNIELSAVYGYEAGRSDGLDAARDAVAVLRDENRQGTDPEWGVLNGALAAIDAIPR